MTDMDDEAMKAMARRICANACGIGKIGRACAADFLSGRADDGTDMAIALAAIIETRDRIVEWLSADYDQLMADAKYLHSHGSAAASELFDKAAHNHRIAAAIRSGQQFRKDV